MLEEIIQWDKDFFLFLNGLGNPNWDALWMFLTDKLSSIPLYILLLVLSIRQFGWKSTGIVLLTIALLITTTDQLANFFKYGVTRLRPCHDEEVFGAMRLVKSYCGGKFGYFSAHAANSMAIASFFSFLFRGSVKWLSIFLLIWAFLVGYSRIYIGVHYPLDVITGLLVGLLFGWLYARLYRKALSKMRL